MMMQIIVLNIIVWVANDFQRLRRFQNNLQSEYSLHTRSCTKGYDARSHGRGTLLQNRSRWFRRCSSVTSGTLKRWCSIYASIWSSPDFPAGWTSARSAVETRSTERSTKASAGLRYSTKKTGRYCLRCGVTIKKNVNPPLARDIPEREKCTRSRYAQENELS